MERAYIFRHWDEEDSSKRIEKAEALRDFLYEREGSKNVVFVSSPEPWAWNTANLISKPFDLSIPAGQFCSSGEIYQGHEEVQGVFPHFGICEHASYDEMNFSDFILPFPAMKKRAEEANNEYVKKIKGVTDSKEREEIKRKSLRGFYKDFFEHTNHEGNDENLFRGVVEGIQGFDTSILISHSGVIGNLSRAIGGGNELTGNPCFNLECLEGLLLDFKEKRIRNVKPRLTYALS